MKSSIKNQKIKDSNTVFGWGDFERKEREEKEIGRKIFYFLCLVEGKS